MRNPNLILQRIYLGIALVSLIPLAQAQAPARRAAPPDLTGVYQVVDNNTVVAGLKNIGSPAGISLLPAAVAQAKTMNLKQDPAKLCQPVGPFRMMAREGNKIEVVPQNEMIVILFEDVAHGLIRVIYTNRQHPKVDKDTEPTWMGDSIGRWEGDTLVVDTVGFNDQTWLNDNGAQHSEALHLVERIRPVLNGKYLEYKITAEDPKALVRPYTYTRYYQKTKAEIMEDICEDQDEE